MNLWLVPLSSLFSLVLMLTYAKLVGYRQISQLSYYDYINTLTLGNLAAQLATSLDNDFPAALIAMLVYGAFALCCSTFARKSRWFRNFISGHAIVLMENGQLFRNNFNEARITLDEFEASLRSQGYFNVASVEAAVMEHNGQISVLPGAGERTVTTSDLNVQTKPQGLVANVIMDGQVLERNLKTVNRTAPWLYKKLQSQGVAAEDVFLGTCDQEGTIVFYKKMTAPAESPL